MLSGLSLSKENVTIRSGYESILRFYGYDLGNGDEGGNGVITTTESKRREQDEQEHSTTVETTFSPTEMMTSISSEMDIQNTESPTTKMVAEPTTTEYNGNKVTEVKMQESTATTAPAPTAQTTAPSDASTERTTERTTERPTEASTQPPMIHSTKLPSILVVTVPPTTATTIPPQLRYLSEITTKFPLTIPTRLTYPLTEESTVLPVTEMTSTSKSTTYIFTFKPITTTPIPESHITTTKRFFNLLTTIPPLAKPVTTESPNARLLNTLTTLPVPTAIRSADPSNARLLNGRNSRVYRIKRDPTNYNNFIPLAPSGYGVSSDADLYDPYFNYATPHPPDLYNYPDGNPIFATREFEQTDHQPEEVDHIFFLNPHDSIRIGFKVYNTILRFAYIQGIQASALELPLDSENYR